MKKYVKPDLFYENYELSQNVASCSLAYWDAGSSANLGNGNACVFDIGGITVFNNENCEANYEDVYEGYCYQTGSAGFSFFHS